ncbi:MAG: phosphoglycolate phosphatase [Rhodospirillales bacterium]
MVCKQGVGITGLKVVVFDLDGTLVDSAPDLQAALNRLMRELGRRPLGLDEVKGMVGDGAAKLVERAVAATGLDGPGDDLGVLTARFLAHYEGHATDCTRPYPGVRETLTRLRAAGLALAVCTNKPEAATREVLKDLDLDGFFAAVVGGDSLPGVRKPDPAMLRAILEAVGASPREAVMVGDNANDVAVARALGVPVVVRADGYTRTAPADLGADAVIDDFAELLDVLAVAAVTERGGIVSAVGRDRSR